VDRNVVYGMYSGLALLMDVHYPVEPNGYGLILIQGSAWYAPTTYDGWQLKGDAVPQIFLDAGYTVFPINHRAAPRFRYPAAVEDAQRAVRFVRHHAERYRIDPARLGGYGGSSGGHLVSMLGTMDGAGNRASAKLQAVAVRAAPTLFAELGETLGVEYIVSFLGAPPGDDATSREASPITYVTPDDPPLLLIHGDADQYVPFAQSQVMLAALKAKGVEVRLIRIPGGGHGANDPPEAARWLNRHLLGEARAHELEPLMAAYAGLHEGVLLARAGEISEALDAYRNAKERDGLTISADAWFELCWHGGLWDHAADVLFACDRALELTPNDSDIRDSRGLVRALLGDMEGAVEDFEFSGQREAWIEALRAGTNPFTSEVLAELRGF
jgi:acetyl esterase/lipase